MGRGAGRRRAGRPVSTALDGGDRRHRLQRQAGHDGPSSPGWPSELVELGAAEVESLVIKPNYSAPAPREVMDRAARWNALVAGVGD